MVGLDITMDDGDVAVDVQPALGRTDAGVAAALDGQSISPQELSVGSGHLTVRPSEGTKGIQQAVNNLPADGGLISLTKGVYDVNNGAQYPGNAVIVDKDNVAIIGQGRETVIRTPDGYSPDERGQKIIDLGGNDADDGNDDHPGFTSLNFVDGCVVANLSIDGNWQNQTPIDDTTSDGAGYDGHNLEAKGADNHFFNIWSHDSTGDGIELTNRAEPVETLRNIVWGCTFRNNWEHCIHVHGGGDTILMGNVCDGEENNGVLHLSNAAASFSNVIILGNIFKNGKVFGVDLSAGRNHSNAVDHVTFAYNIVENNVDDGVRIRGESSADVWAKHNIVRNNGGSGFHVYGRMERCCIAENETSSNQLHGVFLTQAEDGSTNAQLRNIYVKNNWVYGNNQADGFNAGIFVSIDGQPLENVRITGNDVISEGSVLHQHGIWFRELSAGTYDDVIAKRNFVKGFDGNAINDDIGVLRTNNDNVDDAVSAVPAVLGPSAGDEYLDDGTNTSSGNPSYRYYDGTAWVDL